MSEIIMTETMCLYVCITVVLVALIIAVACVLVNGVSCFDFEQIKKENKVLFLELARMQEQCNGLYAMFSENKKKK